jgi:hypothetical protein
MRDMAREARASNAFPGASAPAGGEAPLFEIVARQYISGTYMSSGTGPRE